MMTQEEKQKDSLDSPRQQTVLIVDDQAETLASLRRLLGGEPYSLVTCSSAEEALRWMAANPVDVFIADERMPEMRGSDLLAVVRDRSPRTVRVILTGYPASSTVAYGLSTSVDWLISKPWNNDALKLTILQLLESLARRERIPNGTKETPDGTRPLPAGFDERTPLPLYCIDANGRLLWANHAMLDLIARSRADVVDRPVTEFLEDEASVAELLNRLAGNDSVRNFSARLRTKDGSIRTVLMDADVYRQSRRFSHAWCTIRPDEKDNNEEVLREIAGRKRAEDTLRLSEMRFRLLVEGVKDYAILMLSPDGIVVSWNEGAERINGYKAEEILGRHFSLLYVPEDLESGKPQMLLQKAAELGRIEDEGWHRRKDGTRFWSNVIMTALRDPDGEILGYSKVTRDMTERRKAEEERARLSAQMLQGQKLQAIGQLSAGMAHEINNPVGYILSNLNTMGEYCRDLQGLLRIALKAARSHEHGEDPGPDLAELRAVAAKIRADEVVKDLVAVVSDCTLGGERIRDIVRSLREFSHVDEGELRPTDLSKCLEDSLRICWNEIKYKAEVVKDFGQLPPLPCYPQRIGQVFINLLVNAGQAIEKRGKIFLTTRHEGGEIVVQVRDTGRGIEPENLKRIFEPFFTTKTVGSGTGLGLHVAYKIVIAHGGRIDVQSKPGEGTEFSIRLPIAGPRGGKPREL